MRAESEAAKAKCGGSLDDKGECVDRRQLIDIPPIVPTTTEYHQMAVTCGGCSAINRGKLPAYCYNHISFGRNLHVLTGILFHANYGSYERTQQNLADICKLHISQGTIANILDRIDVKLQPCVSRITFRLISSKQVGSDETGTFIDGKRN